MRPITQKDCTGCGIAAAAAVANISYAQARSTAASLGIRPDDPTLWSDTEPVRRLLKKLGIRVSTTTYPFRSWASIPNRALLAIKWHREGRKAFWHWVVFERQNGQASVLDSKASLNHHRRTDFGRMKPKWYLPFQP